MLSLSYQQSSKLAWFMSPFPKQIVVWYCSKPTSLVLHVAVPRLSFLVCQYFFVFLFVTTFVGGCLFLRVSTFVWVSIIGFAIYTISKQETSSHCYYCHPHCHDTMLTQKYSRKLQSRPHVNSNSLFKVLRALDMDRSMTHSLFIKYQSTFQLTLKTTLVFISKLDIHKLGECLYMVVSVNAR